MCDDGNYKKIIIYSLSFVTLRTYIVVAIPSKII